MLLLTARDITAAPHHHHPTEKVLSDVILLRTARDITAVPNNQYTHHPVMLLLSAFATGVITAESVVHQRHHHHHHLVSSVRLVAWVPIAARVIPILSAHLRAESIVVYHPHHHPVSFVLLVVVASIVVLVIPVRRVPAVIPVTTVVPEKNAMKSVNSWAAVAVAKVAKVGKVAREDTMAVALVDTTVAVDTTEEDSVGKVGKEERVARVATTVDTKFVNSSVHCRHPQTTAAVSVSLFQDIFNFPHDSWYAAGNFVGCMYEQIFDELIYFHCFGFCRYSNYQYCLSTYHPHDALYVAGRLLVSLFISCMVGDMVGVPFLQ